MAELANPFHTDNLEELCSKMKLDLANCTCKLFTIFLRGKKVDFCSFAKKDVLDIPDQRDFISPRRDHITSIRGKRGSGNPFFMSAELVEFLTGIEVPQSRGLVPTACQNRAETGQERTEVTRSVCP